MIFFFTLINHTLHTFSISILYNVAHHLEFLKLFMFSLASHDGVVGHTSNRYIYLIRVFDLSTTDKDRNIPFHNNTLVTIYTFVILTLLINIISWLCNACLYFVVKLTFTLISRYHFLWFTLYKFTFYTSAVALCSWLTKL